MFYKKKKEIESLKEIITKKDNIIKKQLIKINNLKQRNKELEQCFEPQFTFCEDKPLKKASKKKVIAKK